MKNQILRVLMLLVASLSFTSCELIGGIFKAGMGVGIFIVIAIIAIVLIVVSKLFGKK
ncbi:MAG: hypothetical protein K2Y30_02565 [Flavobacteriaceae bacterium]|uniref:Phosphatidate cytidylyltransferase n=1 Tax=Flavobacterium kayseriense TaxID=2764714 RepID=A0ABR7JA29_9FLAO|nr:hypothetical protein [Flavobacterium kayseriense]MBC5842400.1 hypothetical protein [Flavobacterium kayseriense]MBC5848930.1 hypothetical protein [Flavobacterium kayseriense]MBU0940616.1 hypothetical protein [Bacteroidota bacterium]MBX9886799.1 hypothetical protein [Flavobacteriaceae bacterium]